MTCSICKNEESRVLRTIGNRRRRECTRCRHRWTTFEIPEPEVRRLQTIDQAVRGLAAAVAPEVLPSGATR